MSFLFLKIYLSLHKVQTPMKATFCTISSGLSLLGKQVSYIQRANGWKRYIWADVNCVIMLCLHVVVYRF